MKWKFYLDKFMKTDKKIKIVSVIFIIAIIFLLMPDFAGSKKQTSKSVNIENMKKSVEKDLSARLSKIEGVKKASVYLTYENDGTNEYATEEKTNTKNDTEDGKKSSQQIQNEKKPVFDGSKNIIVKSRVTPEIKGVCVYYTGDGGIETQSRLYRAVKGSLGVELHKIEVILSAK